MSEFSENTISELDTCFLVNEDKKPSLYSLLKESGTVELAKVLINGLPLGYYDHYELAKLSSDELENFHESISFIESAWYGYDEKLKRFLNLTVKDGIDEANLSRLAFKLYIDKFYNQFRDNLNTFVSITNSKILVSILEDSVFANNYICFNATNSSTLVLKNFRLIDDFRFEYDFNMYRSDSTNSMFADNASSDEFQLWNLLLYVNNQLSDTNSDLYQMFLDYTKKCDKHNKIDILLANYAIPFIVNEITWRKWVAYWSDTDRHNFYVVFRPKSNRIVEKLTNKRTGKVITKTHKLAEMTSGPDLIWKAAKTIYDFGFV